MVQIEKRSLGSFKKEPFARFDSFVQIHDGIRDEWRQLATGGEVGIVYLGEVDRPLPKGLQDRVILLDLGVKLL